MSGCGSELPVIQGTEKTQKTNFNQKGEIMSTKNILPNNPELEKAVLNFWLSGENPSSKPPPEDLFYNPAHKEIISAIRAIQSAKGQIDPLSVYAHIQANIKNPITSHATLGEITAGLIAKTSYETNIRQLEDLSQRRAMVWHIDEIKNSIFDESFPRVVAYVAKRMREISNSQNTYTTSTGFPNLVCGLTLNNESVEKPHEIIEGILRQGQKMVVQSASKANKTNLAISRALAVANGVPWLGRKTLQGPVLFVNFELPSWAIHERTKVISSGMGIEVPDHFKIWNLRGTKFSGTRHLLDELLHRIEKEAFHPILIELDPIYKLYKGRKENESGEMGQVLEEIDDIISETKAAVSFSHHYSKGNKSQADILDRSAGSGIFARDVDAILDLLPHEEQNCFILSSSLRTERNIVPFVFEWDYPICRVREDLDPDRPKKKNGKKSVEDLAKFVVLIEPQERVRGRELTDRASKILRISRTKAYELIKKSKEAGLIQMDPITKKYYRSGEEGLLEGDSESNNPF